jgi:hypothetical protein
VEENDNERQTFRVSWSEASLMTSFLVEWTFWDYGRLFEEAPLPGERMSNSKAEFLTEYVGIRPVSTHGP